MVYRTSLFVAILLWSTLTAVHLQSKSNNEYFNGGGQVYSHNYSYGWPIRDAVMQTESRVLRENQPFANRALSWLAPEFDEVTEWQWDAWALCTNLLFSLGFVVAIVACSFRICFDRTPLRITLSEVLMLTASICFTIWATTNAQLQIASHLDGRLTASLQFSVWLNWNQGAFVIAGVFSASLMTLILISFALRSLNRKFHR